MVVLLVHAALILVHLSAKSVLALPVIPDDIDARERPWTAMFLPHRTAPNQRTWMEDLDPRPHALPHLHDPSEAHPRPQRTTEARQDAERSSWSVGEKREVLSKKGGERRPSEANQEVSGVAQGVVLTPQRPRHVKRSEGAKIPTVGLGVLSDLRNFFTELRTNLDSVEALAQEQGAAGLHPADLLALLAKEEARSQALAGLPNETLPQGLSMRALMLGSPPNDQRYANSGLGK